MARKNRYELTNKVACANFETASRFLNRKEGAIAEVFNIADVQTRLINGDGANWIKEDINGKDLQFQLDVFHRNKAIVEKVRDPAKRRLFLKILYEEKNPHKVIDAIEGTINALEGDPEREEEKNLLVELYYYFKNNEKYLIPFYQREDLDLPAQMDKDIRHLGCMESNILTIIGNRMKRGRTCWSINGGNNMARLLCLKHTNRIQEITKYTSQLELPEKYNEIFNWKTIRNASSGSGYDGFHTFVAPPTSDYSWLKAIGRVQHI